MPSQTSRKNDAEPTMGHGAFTAGNHLRQVQTAGLLVHDPELRDAELTELEWVLKLEEYAATPRPTTPADLPPADPESE